MRPYGPARTGHPSRWPGRERGRARRRPRRPGRRPGRSRRGRSAPRLRRTGPRWPPTAEQSPAGPAGTPVPGRVHRIRGRHLRLPIGVTAVGRWVMSRRIRERRVAVTELPRALSDNAHHNLLLTICVRHSDQVPQEPVAMPGFLALGRILVLNPGVPFPFFRCGQARPSYGHAGVQPLAPARLGVVLARPPGPGSRRAVSGFLMAVPGPLMAVFASRSHGYIDGRWISLYQGAYPRLCNSASAGKPRAQVSWAHNRGYGSR